jgi:broad specificity phosphatase PhoE
MQLVFVRHGESFGNLGGEYDLSDSGELTPTGLEQAQALVPRLLDLIPKFDSIVVSPLARAIGTLLPYLKKTGQTAEIWPELCEMAGRDDGAGNAPVEVRYGKPVVVPDHAKSLLRLRNDDKGQYMPPTGEIYSEGCRRARAASERIKALYAGKDITLLMVGHACCGARVIEALLDIEQVGRFQHNNTGMTLLDQKANGDFITRYVNRIA